MSVQCSPLTDLVIGGHEGLSSRDSLPVFSAGGHLEQFWRGWGCPVFDIVLEAFPLLATAFKIQDLFIISSKKLHTWHI